MNTRPRRFFRLLLLAAAVALGAGRAGADTIAAGQDFAGSIDSGGVLRVWGKNSSGQLGIGSFTTSVSQPMPVTGGPSPSTWKHVAMGQDFTLAISTADELWAWGNNTSGQLGNGISGPTASSSSPVRVNLPAGSIVKAIVAGGNGAGDGFGFAAAVVDVPSLSIVGGLYTWGANSRGQLGKGSTSNSSTPTRVGTKSYSTVAATALATAAITANGELWAWGHNSQAKAPKAAPLHNFTRPLSNFIQLRNKSEH